MKQPIIVKKIYGMLKDMEKDDKKVSQRDINKCLVQAFSSKRNRGLWIKKEENTMKKTIVLSILRIAEAEFLRAYRVVIELP